MAEKFFSEELLSLVIQSIGDGTIITDRNGKVFRMNLVAEKLTGWQFHDALGRDFSEIFRAVNKKTRYPIKNITAKAIERKETLELANDTMLISRDGTERLIADTVAPIYTNAGAIIGAVIVFHDITEREKIMWQLLEDQKKLQKQTLELDSALKESLKSREILSSMLNDNNKIRESLDSTIVELKKLHSQLEETRFQLVQSAKMATIGTLSASVAHDINNPLMGIMLLLESLMLEKEKGTKEQEILLQMENGLKRIAGIVAKLLEFSRKGELTLNKMDINEVIDSGLPLILHEFALNEIHLAKNYGKDLPKVEISINEMQQVIINVLLNAKDASMNSHTKDISITTYLENDMVKISIKDKGTGMKKDILDSVFVPFFTTKPTGKGLGIGMSIVKNIINHHYGKVEIYSEEQKGTEVILSLPLPKS